MAIDFSKLENIFQMTQPSNLVGAKRLALGKDSTNIVRQLLDVIYDNGATSVLSADKLIEKMNELLCKVKDEEVKNDFKKTFFILSSIDKQPSSVDENMNKSKDNNNEDVKKTTLQQLIGKNTVDKEYFTSKPFSILLLSSPYISPATRNTEKCEIFLNSIPSYHASLLVPYLQVEFELKRNTADSTNFGLMRFLLGGEIDNIKNDDATKKIINAKTFKENGIEKTNVGMEIFTSPQTLQNLNPVSRAGRYATVIDPMRPLASIESFSVSIEPQVYKSYKKATLILKLHDRSRLAEIADLVRPQVYQNAATAPTVWMTYGWRYPAIGLNDKAGSESYAAFINGNMLVREAYGIANTTFSFDDVGQVSITLELFTKGAIQFSTMKITDKFTGMKKVMEEFESLSNEIKILVNKSLGESAGILREIKAYQVINDAQLGTWPDIKPEEVRKSLEEIKNALNKQGITSKQTEELFEKLKKYYESKDKKNFEYKENFKKRADAIAQDIFKELSNGYDLFMVSEEKNGSDAKHSAIIKNCKSYLSSPTNKKLKQKNSVCSFGKLLSVFTANAHLLNNDIDELQIMFYTLNNNAGNASNLNIAQFPIELPVFIDQFRHMVEQQRSIEMTVDQFIKLVIDAQLHDERSLAYGFKDCFKPYDPDKPNEKGELQNSKDYELRSFTFAKPEIQIDVETLCASDDAGKDLLYKFELQQTGGDYSKSKMAHMKKIMRIHIYDKQSDPYKMQQLLLKSDNGNKSRYYTINSNSKKELDPSFIKNYIKNVELTNNGDAYFDLSKSDSNSTVFGNYESIKQFISKTMPTIIYGANGTMVKQAQLASKQDSLLAATMMQTHGQKTGKPTVGQPNGAGTGGLPLKIVPAAMSMTTIGCPLLANSQIYFVDFGTGTTADNLYRLSNLTHTISPGRFESTMTMTFADAFGKYEGASEINEWEQNYARVQKAKAVLDKNKK